MNTDGMAVHKTVVICALLLSHVKTSSEKNKRVNKRLHLKAAPSSITWDTPGPGMQCSVPVIVPLVLNVFVFFRGGVVSQHDALSYPALLITDSTHSTFFVLIYVP